MTQLMALPTTVKQRRKFKRCDRFFDGDRPTLLDGFQNTAHNEAIQSLLWL